MKTLIDSFRRLSDDALLAEVHLLVQRERDATTVLVASLAEVDGRSLYLGLGYPSLYRYCLGELHLSERSAFARIHAARAVRRFPIALKYLAEGSLTLTNLTVLAPHLTARNHRQLLKAARYKTRHEVERQVAALNPEAPDMVTLRVRVPRATYDKLRHAQDLLRHTVPDGDLADVLERAVTLLVNDLERTKFARVARPRRPRQVAAGSRRVPAAVRRLVTERDGGRCAFVGANGRCPETAFLEFHHMDPFAAGGPPTVSNIQLRCAAHNRYEGKQAFPPDPPLVRERAPAYGAAAVVADALRGADVVRFLPVPDFVDDRLQVGGEG
jgi:hypothetical protein